MADAASKFAGHTLYQFNTCPFCIKVKLAMWRMGIELPQKNIKSNRAFREELIAGGGKKQVPCLRIESAAGDIRWMYESDDIIAYLKQKRAA